jgi:hypothetical protein
MLGRTALTNKLVSKQLGIEEKKVESVVNFLFKELQDEMSRMEDPYIYVKGLGTFGINLKVVDRRIIALLGFIRKQKELERKGVVYNKRDKMIAGMKVEIFRLFEVRRMVKKRKLYNKTLRNGKALHDIKG